jgi:hypothetical protein
MRSSRRRHLNGGLNNVGALICADSVRILLCSNCLIQQQQSKHNLNSCDTITQDRKKSDCLFSRKEQLGGANTKYGLESLTTNVRSIFLRSASKLVQTLWIIVLHLLGIDMRATLSPSPELVLSHACVVWYVRVQRVWGLLGPPAAAAARSSDRIIHVHSTQRLLQFAVVNAPTTQRV